VGRPATIGSRRPAWVGCAARTGRLDRSGALTLSEEGRTAGVGAGVGGILGGLLGGFKGAMVGAVSGAGGAIAATEGKDIVLPAGTIVRVRFDSAAEVRRS
jgi:outer membrane lipoprotein SlyB